MNWNRLQSSLHPLTLPRAPKKQRDGFDLNTRSTQWSEPTLRGAYPCNTVEWSGRLGLASRAMDGLVPIMLSEKDGNKMFNYVIYISWGEIP